MPMKRKPTTLFRKGQRVTLSTNPTIKLGKYEFLKPMASVTFEISDDPESDLREGTRALREAIYQSMLTDLGVRNEIAEFLGDDDDTPVSVSELARFITGKVAHDVVRITEG